jgi:hypothetical protein
MRWKVGVSAALVGCAVSALAGEARAEAPNREGFTLEVGLGAALTILSAEGFDTETKGGLAPLSLSLGGFLSPDVALMARRAGTSYFEDFVIVADNAERDAVARFFWTIATPVNRLRSKNRSSRWR